MWNMKRNVNLEKYIHIDRYICIYSNHPAYMYIFGSGGHWEQKRSARAKDEIVILIWDKAKSVCSRKGLSDETKTVFECDNGLGIIKNVNAY